MTDWFVYVARCSDGTLYTGISTDLNRRMQEHNADDKRGSKYTRARRPVELVYWEVCSGRAEAAQREYEIRRSPKPLKDALITADSTTDAPVEHGADMTARSVRDELIALMHTVLSRVTPPLITCAYLPEPQPSAEKDAEFGVIGLADGSAGLFYAWLGESQRGLSTRFSEHELIGANPADLVALYGSADEIDRSLGLAAINAISQHVFSASGFILNMTSDSMADLAFAPEDHVGIVGYFPSFVRRLRERGLRVTVVERKPQFACSEPGLEITLDASKLSCCNKVLATGAMLLNDTLDGILENCRRAEIVAIVGPTASCLPDPLFARGVDLVGGAKCVDVDGLVERAMAGRSFGDTARKYTISAGCYPGIRQLLGNR